MNIHTPMIFCTSHHHYQNPCGQAAVGLSQYIWSICVSRPHLPRLYFLSLLSPCCAPPPLCPRLPPECHQLFHHLPPLWSVSVPQDLSSDWDGMFQGCTIPGANEILNQFMEPPPPCPLPLPPRSFSLWPLHLGTSSSSPVPRCSPSLLQHGLISLPLSPRMNPHPAPPPPTLTLCPPFTSLSGMNLPSPLPLFILPHPTRPVQTAALLQFMGLLQQLPAVERKSKKKTGRGTWETCGGNWNMWWKKRVGDKDRGWIRLLNKWLNETGARDPSSSIEATVIPVCC